MNIQNSISKIFIKSLALLLLSVNSFTTQTTIAQIFINTTDDNIYNIHQEAIAKNEKKFICTVPAKIPEKLTTVFHQATENIPCELLQSLERVEIFEDETQTLPRAMANARILKVRADAISDPEIVAVLIHELAHVVDLGGLTGTYSNNPKNISEFHDGALAFYHDDLSLLFYQISWTPKSPRADSSYLDFVGGYAKYDMFEDFAESFVLYINHGKYFKALALENKKLQRKYIFFKYYIFRGKEFSTGNIPDNLLIRNWDMTKL